MPLESFMRRKMHSSLSPSPSSASSSPAAEKRSSAHFSMAAKREEALEASHASQSAVQAEAAAAASSDQCCDEAEAEEESQVSQDYEVVDYQRRHEDALDEEGATDECNSHEEQSYVDAEDAEGCSATLQHLSGRISDAKARHCQQVADVSAEIDKMRTALKRYIDGLMDQLHRDFVAHPDAAQVASLDQLQDQCSKLQNSKRKIAQMGAMWEKKAKLIRQA